MDRTTDYNIELEQLRRSEADLLIRFVAEKHARNSTRVRKLSSAELLSYSLMSNRAEYTQLIKKYYGGWSCGTHTNKVRERLTHSIIEKFTESQISAFINYCLAAYDADQKFDMCTDADIKFMTRELLSMRPRPLVNIMASLLKANEK